MKELSRKGDRPLMMADFCASAAKRRWGLFQSSFAVNANCPPMAKSIQIHSIRIFALSNIFPSLSFGHFIFAHSLKNGIL
jgi:hypothetical protein